MSGDTDSTWTDAEIQAAWRHVYDTEPRCDLATLLYLNRVAMGYAPCYQRTRDEQLKARALVNKARPPFDQEKP